MICEMCAIITIDEETVIVVSFHVSKARRQGGTRQDRAVEARQVHTLKAVGSSPTPATSELLT